ncbi:hypothetical protein DAMA08_032790 [Martiniozyma asiatica (nom. inval.)]|nr:hypothetical protein DAMA08_032790 [Martiniozyma asiatica]
MGNQKSINDLFMETKDSDPDLRYMALNDLDNELNIGQSSKFQSRHREQYAKILQCTIDDEFEEVSTQSLKCFSKFGAYCNDQVANMLIWLFKNINNKNSISITSSIYTMAIHNMLKSTNFSTNCGKTISQVLKKFIFENSNSFTTKVDLIEILYDLVQYSGEYLTNDEIENLIDLTLVSIYQGDNIISKKGLITLKRLVGYLKLEKTKEKMFNSIIDGKCKDGKNKNSLALHICKVIFEGNSKFMQNYTDRFLNIISNVLKVNDLNIIDDDYDLQQVKDSNRVDAILLLQTLISFGNVENFVNSNSGFIYEVQKLIVYDPYNSNNDIDGENDSNSFISENDEYDDEYSDEDYNADDNNDNSDISWKIRHDSIKTVGLFCQNYPQCLPIVYTCFGNILSDAINTEKNKMVIIASIETFTLIFSATAKDEYYYNLKSLEFLNKNQGRRRSDVSMKIDDDPALILSQIGYPVIQKFSEIVSKFPQNDYMNIYFKFLINFSIAVDGFENYDNFLEQILMKFDCLYATVGPTIEKGRFFSSILKQNSLESFGSGYKVLINFIKAGISERNNHKLLALCLNIINDILSYIARDNAAPDFVILLSDSISDVLIEKTSNRSLSTDIRKLSLSALCSIVLLINPTQQFSQNLINLLIMTLSIEDLAPLTMDLVVKIIENGKLNIYLTPQFVDSVLTMLIEYLSIKDFIGCAAHTIHTMGLAHLLYSDQALLILSKITQHDKIDEINDNICIDLGDAIFSCLAVVETSEINLKSVIKFILHLAKSDNFCYQSLNQIVSLLSKSEDESHLHSLCLSVKNESKLTTVKFLAALAVAHKDPQEIQSKVENLDKGKDVVESLTFMNQVAQSQEIYSDLQIYVKYFLSDNNNIQQEAIKTVASIIVANKNHFQEFLSSIDKIELVLPLLKCLSIITKKINLNDTLAQNIIEYVFNIQNKYQIINESEFYSAAQCIANIVIRKGEYLDKIINTLLSCEKFSLLHVTVAATGKYLFNDEKFVKSTPILELGELLSLSSESLIFQNKLELKNVGIANLYQAIVKKPIVAVPFVARLIPKLMETEVKINKSYVRVIQIGPFKSKIDDGLGYRKQVYEILYYLVKSIQENPKLGEMGNISWANYVAKMFDYAVKDDNSITSVCLLTLGKIVETEPTIFINNEIKEGQVDSIQSIIQRTKKIFDKKLSDTANKQEIENQEALKTLISRFLANLNDSIEKGLVPLRPNQSAEWSASLSVWKRNV